MIDIDAQLVKIVQTTDIALRLISARLLTFGALLMTGGIFGWALAAQTVLGCIIATIWGLLVFNPILWMGRGGLDHAGQLSQGYPPAERNHAVPLEDEPRPTRGA